MSKINQYDANFLAGIEVGVRCAESGMNLQAALEFGQKSIRLFPQRNYKGDDETSTGRAIAQAKHGKDSGE